MALGRDPEEIIFPDDEDFHDCLLILGELSNVVFRTDLLNEYIE